MTRAVAAEETPLSDSNGERSVSFFPDVMIPRGYQLDLLEHAKKENATVYFETGCGKTHVAVMLLQYIADVIRKPSTRIVVFLCPTVYLVQQQAKVIKQNTDLKVGTYFGEMNIDAWKSETWEAELAKNEVFVMTPAILLQNLHHCFMRLDCIELLIFDECHHADKGHPYACIMQLIVKDKGLERSKLNLSVCCTRSCILWRRALILLPVLLLTLNFTNPWKRPVLLFKNSLNRSVIFKMSAERTYWAHRCMKERCSMTNTPIRNGRQ